MGELPVSNHESSFEFPTWLSGRRIIARPHPSPTDRKDAKSRRRSLAQATIAPPASTPADSADSYDQKWLLLPKMPADMTAVIPEYLSRRNHELRRRSRVRRRLKQALRCTFALKKGQETLLSLL
ncbi:MAG: hypothetical protein DWI29_01320 [Planctomycetota bacterium]|nr:MAG: hypothetical protein DWI29_01320 [Planctomycetota bacterium]